MDATFAKTPSLLWLTTVTSSQGMESASGDGVLAVGLADDFAAVVGFPKRAGEMFSEWLAIFVEELGVGSS